MAYIKLLKNVPLDNSYSNPILFSDAVVPDGMVKVTYDNFFSKYSDNGVWMPSVNDLHMNIRIGDGINTTIIVPDAQWQPSYNYAIIRFTENEIKPCQFQVDGSGRVNQPFFYFITNCVPLGKGGYVLTLELDVMTTYFSHIKLDHQIFTERKHCNRWESGNDLISWKDAILSDNIDGAFNGKKISDIHKDNVIEYIDQSKVNEDVNARLLNVFLNQTMWAYLFFTITPSSYIGTSDLSKAFIPLIINGKNNQTYNTQLMCIAVPCGTCAITLNAPTGSQIFERIAYKSNQPIFDYLIQQDGCIGAKLSFRSPFCKSVDYRGEDKYLSGTQYGLDIYANGSTDETYATKSGSTNYVCRRKRIGNLDIFYTLQQAQSEYQLEELFVSVNELPDSFLYTEDIIIPIPNKSVYKGQYYLAYNEDKNLYYEPKLYCSPYYKLTLTSQFGGSYDFNPLLLNSVTTKIKMCCEISPEPDKIYFTLTTGQGSPYARFTETNTGVTIINDNNIPYKSDAYATYLREHRASAITGLAIGIGTGISEIGLGGRNIASGKTQSGLSTITGGVSEVASSIGSVVSNVVDLKNTPDAIKNMGNNPVHDFAMKNDTHPYLVSYELFDNEKQQVFDYFYDNGYKVNRKCYLNIKDFTDTEQIITRQKFNYIKINDNIINEIEFLEENPRGNITYFVPQIVKQKINSILNRGCKLWTLIYKNQTGATWQDFYLGSDFENAEIYIPD